jgi:hypothetical protein
MGSGELSSNSGRRPSRTTASSWAPAVAVGLGAVAGLGLLGRLLFPAVETRPHVAGPSGYVEASPAGLARAAGVELATYALASAMESEEEGDKGRLAVGRAAWNAARGRRDRLVRLLLPRDRLGSQLVNPYASTARGPTARTIQLAQAVVDGRVPDIVQGAVQWDAPAAQDRRHQLYLRDPARYPRYRHSSADVARRRTAAGAREVRVPGVPSTRFWTYA